MTAILAAQDLVNCKTYVMADSATDAGERRYLSADKLIMCDKGQAVIGAAGDLPLIQRLVRLIPHKWDLIKWVEAILDCELDGKMTADFVVAEGPDLYLVDSYGCVVREIGDHVAIGSGGGYADAAYRVAKQLTPDVRDRMLVAMQTTADLSPQVSAPFHRMEVFW